MKLLLLPLLFILVSCFSQAQTVQNPALDAALVHGENDFFSQFARKVGYPAEARKKGIMGLLVVRFSVDCEGQIGAVTFDHAIGGGIEESFSKLLKELPLQWKDCGEREAATPIVLRIGYVLNSGFEPERPDFVVNGYAGDGPAIFTDAQLLSDIEKELKKKKKDKAIYLLDQLIRRYPDRTEYQERKEAILAEGK